jgi:hypothetical protein
MIIRHAAQGACRLDPDPDGGRGEVGQRYLFHLDYLHRVRVRARRDGAFAGFVPRLVQDGLPAVGAQVEDPVHLAADRRDGGADGIGRVEVLRPDDLADARYPVGNQDAAAADGDERAVLLGGLHPVDRLGEHHVGPGQRLGQHPLVAAEHVRPARAGQAQGGPPGRHRAVCQRGRCPAEHQRLLRQQVADAARPDAEPGRAVGHHRAPAEGDRDQVRHPEVGPDAADLDALGRLPREAVGQHADIGGGAADVGHQRIGHPGEEGGAADAVGRAAADRQDGIAQGLVEAHQRAVVLREERHRPQAVRGQRGPHRPRHVAGHAGQGAVEDGGVLPLEQPDRADLVAERGVHVAEFALDHLGGEQLVTRRDRGEHAGDRDAVGRAADLAEEPRDGIGVERGQVLAVELDPAVHDRGAHRHGLDQVRRPPEHGPDAVGGRPADPDHRHPPQVPALQDGVGRVGGAEHDMADPAGIGARRPEHGVDRRHDPGGDVGAAWHLGLGDHPVGGVHDHGVGVGASDVDAETAVRRWHRRAPLRAGSRSRSRTRAARPP